MKTSEELVKEAEEVLNAIYYQMEGGKLTRFEALRQAYQAGMASAQKLYNETLK